MMMVPPLIRSAVVIAVLVSVLPELDSLVGDEREDWLWAFVEVWVLPEISQSSLSCLWLFLGTFSQPRMVVGVL